MSRFFFLAFCVLSPVSTTTTLDLAGGSAWTTLMTNADLVYSQVSVAIGKPVRLTFAPVGSAAAFADYVVTEPYSALLTSIPFPDNVFATGKYIQNPFVANAVAITAKVNGLSSPFNLSLANAVAVFRHDITTWDDSRILADNPALVGFTGITNQTIELLIPTDADLIQIWQGALQLIDSTFPVSSTPTTVWPYAATSVAADDSSVFNVNWAIGISYYTVVRTLPYLAAVPATLGSSLFVQPTTARLESTVAARSASEYSAANALNLMLHPTARYPFAFWGYLAFDKLVPAGATGTTRCNQIGTLADWVSWMQTVDTTVADVESRGYVLSASVASVLAGLYTQLDTVQCNGAYPSYTPVLFGGGSTAISVTFGSWINDFTTAQPTDTWKLLYDPSGSGAGKAGFIAGTYAIAMSEAILDTTETAAAVAAQREPLELPAAALAVGFAYNIPGLAEPLVLDQQTFVGIYTGSIQSWDDAALVANNPGLAGVAQPIRLAIRSDLSGTTNAVLTALSIFNPTVVPALYTSGVENMTQFLLNYPGHNVFQAASGSGGVRTVVRATNYSFGYYSWSSTDTVNLFASWRQPGLAGQSPAVVNCSEASVTSALNEKADLANLYAGINGAQGNTAWPVSTITYIIAAKQFSTSNCLGYDSLINFLGWIQLNQLQTPSGVATGPRYASASLGVLASATCCPNNDLTACRRSLRIGPCLTATGTICSEHGSCSRDGSSCTCDPGWTGAVCDLVIEESSVAPPATEPNNLPLILGLALGLGIPFLVAVVALALFFVLRKKDGAQTWLIPYDKLEFQEKLGGGGFGDVWKAEWRGETVAVKTMLSDVGQNKQSLQAFKNEMAVMIHLRHPNVILFMGAVIDPPHYGIVMELMPLGSLYEILHNEDLPPIPYTLKLRLLLQSARGMNFLHTNDPPILHRDLKSLNILVDGKWTAKIADFGLTTFREDTADAAEGTLLWTSPEVLEDPTSYTAESDMYSFGIIMWEVLTQQELHPNLHPATVALGVLRDGLRPPIPPKLPNELATLMSEAWDEEPTVRPTFRNVVKKLTKLVESEAPSSSQRHGSGSASGSRSFSDKTQTEREIETLSPAPLGHICVLFTDICGSGELWQYSPAAMSEALAVYLEVFRSCSEKHSAYKCKTEAETHMLAFQNTSLALDFALELNMRLLETAWPQLILLNPLAAEEWDDDDVTIFRGLRLRIGLDYGEPDSFMDPSTRVRDYYGAPVNRAASVTGMCPPGRILLTRAAARQAKKEMDESHDHVWVERGLVKKFAQSQFAEGKTETIFELRIREIASRFLVDGSEPDFKTVLTAPKQNLGGNLARWVINFTQLKLGKVLGQGSYGVVFKAQWRGLEVAVKRFMRRHLKGDSMLEFKAEVGIHCDLQHKNILGFIGACIKPPNLCLVTEYCANGSLRDVLDRSEKLSWKRKVNLMGQAAAGLAYIHALTPPIIHRDLKSSNLLITADYDVKLADFGFARVKADNRSMTQRGTPAWTAPEVIRSGRYDEGADIYSFAVVMWETLTGERPYEGRRFMEVAKEVLEGGRPTPIPSSADKSYVAMMKRSWNDVPEKRPNAKALERYFNQRGSEEPTDERGVELKSKSPVAASSRLSSDEFE